jgi:hypothetical protein
MKNIFYFFKNKITYLSKLVKEQWLFYVLVILNLVPAFYRKILPSMDGGAHLYNSQLIQTLIFDSSSIVHQFYKLNPEIVPNWTGHFILSFFNYFFPAFIAEKVLLTAYLIAFPLAFRALIKTLSPQNVWLSYFVFLFTYHFLFLLGFYNYSIALVLMLVGLNYWIKNCTQTITITKFLTLFFILCVTYLSHIFVFAFLLFVMCVYLLVKTFSLDPSFAIRKIKFFVQKSFILFTAAIVPLIFLFFYFYNRPSTGMSFYETPQTLWTWILDIRPWIVYDYHREAILNRVIGGALVLMFLNLLVLRIIKFTKYKEPILKANDFLFLVAILALLLFFVLPDSDGAAGFVSVRFCYLFFLFFFFALSTTVYPKWIKIMVLAILLPVIIVHNFGFNKTIKSQYKIVQSIVKASRFIPENAVVLPLNFSKNWLAGNYDNYLGIDKPMVILHNYEASTGYFPVHWNREKMPNTLLGNQNSIPKCLDWIGEKAHASYVIDYVFILVDYIDEELKCKETIEKSVRQNYRLLYSDEYCHLYTKKL